MVVRSVAHRLKDHEGGIFCCRWNERGDALATASDDRTVRLWRRHTTNESGGDASGQSHGWALAWTGWGHTDRVWDVRWAAPSANGGICGGAWLVSCREDFLVRG